MKLTAVIIDDVSQARKTLKEDLATYCPNLEVIGEADGVVTGSKLLNKIKPDIIFLDIQLQDGTGFDILEILGDISFQVIFITASDEFAIKAFKFSAIDYLLKPIDPDDLMGAVNKIETQNEPTSRLELLKENLNHPKKIALNTVDKIHIVDIDEVIRLEKYLVDCAGGTKGTSKIKHKVKTIQEYLKQFNN